MKPEDPTPRRPTEAPRFVASRAGDAPDAAESAEPRAPSEPFPEVPGYDLVDELGRGGMGVVYEGYQRSTGRKVAIKFMRGLGRDLSLRFEREVDLLARLTIPGVVSVIDSGTHAGRWYYVMERVDGVPLDERIPPGEGDIRQTLTLLADVADVVTSAHERGVLHRDLKPSNILVDNDGRVRLLDFGLAKSIDPDSGVNAEVTISEPGRPMGTLAYMPPEQAAGHGASVRSDVYALGVIGYFLLTGQHPIQIGGTLLEAVDRIRTAPIPRASTLRDRLNADIDAILAKATAKLPADRYATAADLAADIRRWLQGRPITARRVSGAVRAWRWAMRNKILVGVVGGACVAIVAIGVSAFVRVLHERDRANALLLETFSHFQQVEQMEDVARQRVAAAERIYGKNNRLYAVAVLQLGLVLERLQRNVEAEVVIREGVEIVRRLKGVSDADRSLAAIYLGRILFWQTKHEEAIPLLQESRHYAQKALREDPNVADGAAFVEAHAALFLGSSLKDSGRLAESEEPLRSACQWWSADPPARDDGWYTGALRTYADCLVKLGRPDEALAVFLEAIRREEQAVPLDENRRLRIVQSLAELYMFLGRQEEAKPYAEEFRRALEAGRKPFSQQLHFPEFNIE